LIDGNTVNDEVDVMSSGPTEACDWTSSELMDVAGNVCVCDVRQFT